MVIAKVHVTLKNGILDPQGKTVHHALQHLGFEHIDEVRIGKYIELKFNNCSPSQARQLAERACEKLLANPVVEEYEIVISEHEQDRGRA